MLLQAFLKKDFSFGYVAENSDASLSTFYRIAGFWAGQQGSFLLWLLLIAVVDRGDRAAATSARCSASSAAP